MVLGDVEESVTTRDIDEETDEEIVRVRVDVFDYMFNFILLKFLLI